MNSVLLFLKMIKMQLSGFFLEIAIYIQKTWEFFGQVDAWSFITDLKKNSSKNLSFVCWN